MTIQTIADLKPDPHNARKHNPRNLGMVINALHEVGAARSIVIDENGVILAGNGVVEAAADAGIERVQVVDADGETIIAVRRTGLTDKQKTRLALFDNRAAELAEWDAEAIAADLEAGVELGDLFDKGELDEIMADLEPEPGEAPEAQIDKADELQQKWGTARGQLWEIGKHRLLCGDSTVAEDVQRLMGGEKPLLMVADPPYGVEYDANWRNEAAEKGLISYAASRVGKVANDDRLRWCTAYTLSPCSVAYIWHASLYGDDVKRGLNAAGFELRSQIIWAKHGFAISRGHYHWAHECCWYAVRKGQPAKWAGSHNQRTLWADILDTWKFREDGTLYAVRLDEQTVYAFPGSCTTVWELNVDKNVDGGHSTQKPVECMARPIRNHEGDVYDPFLGSGTTMVAAEQLGRRAFGIEIEPKYVAVTLERMAAMGLEPRLLSNSPKG